MVQPETPTPHRTVGALLRRSACCLLLPLSATAAEYQLQLFETPQELAKRSDPSPAGQAYWAAFAAYGEALKAAGILRGGAALRAGDEARSVRVTASRTTVAAPRLAHAPARPGGYFVIDVDSLDTALAWAAKSPTAQTGGVVDVRPFYPVPGMAR